jgi:hypothetical protein
MAADGVGHRLRGRIGDKCVVDLARESIGIRLCGVSRRVNQLPAAMYHG